MEQAPIVREHIYSCPICGETAPPLRFIGGFRKSIDPEGKDDQFVEIKIYRCDNCQSIFISLNGDFFNGRFEDILQMYR